MVSSRTASAPPQKKCKKKGLPHYFNATASFIFGSLRFGRFRTFSCGKSPFCSAALYRRDSCDTMAPMNGLIETGGRNAGKPGRADGNHHL